MAKHQIIPLFISAVSCVLTFATCIWNQWEVSGNSSSNLLGSTWAFRGLWEDCMQLSSGQYQCNAMGMETMSIYRWLLIIMLIFVKKILHCRFFFRCLFYLIIISIILNVFILYLISMLILLMNNNKNSDNFGTEVPDVHSNSVFCSKYRTPHIHCIEQLASQQNIEQHCCLLDCYFRLVILICHFYKKPLIVYSNAVLTFFFTK